MVSVALLERARELARKCPHQGQHSPPTWAGKGNGRRCNVCEQPITSDQVEYEIDCEQADGIQSYRMHNECFFLWREAAQSKSRS